MNRKTPHSRDDEPPWELFVDSNARNLEERKSLKVKLPIRQHIKLHAMKLFTENNISQTIERALDRYFEELKAEESGSRSKPEGVGPDSHHPPSNP